MASQGASLQNYNNELVKCIEDLREKREDINKQILKDEEEKAKIQRDLSSLTDEYDRTIQETESAYMKILESSQTLLQVLKRESVSLINKK
jgi:sjoegren syndrome nuclear autoantigen 1